MNNLENPIVQLILSFAQLMNVGAGANVTEECTVAGVSWNSRVIDPAVWPVTGAIEDVELDQRSSPADDKRQGLIRVEPGSGCRFLRGMREYDPRSTVKLHPLE